MIETVPCFLWEEVDVTVMLCVTMMLCVCVHNG